MNEASQPQSFRVGFGGMRSGIQLTAQPLSFDLNSEESRDIVITLSVNTNTLPNRPIGTSLSYDGTVVFFGTVDTVRIPWAFTKALKLRLTFDEPNPFFLVTGQDYARDVFDAIRIDPFAFDLLLPDNGTYDVFTFFEAPGFEPPELVFKQNVTVLNSSTLDIRTTDAPHLINLDGLDEKGQQL
jgi:hypothetical protein